MIKKIIGVDTYEKGNDLKFIGALDDQENSIVGFEHISFIIVIDSMKRNYLWRIIRRNFFKYKISDIIYIYVFELKRCISS